MDGRWRSAARVGSEVEPYAGRRSREARKAAEALTPDLYHRRRHLATVRGVELHWVLAATQGMIKDALAAA